MSAGRRKPWRHWVRVLHRDIGYFLAALVCAYSISGVAVNHIDDWNPSYRIESTRTTIEPLTGDVDAMQAQAIQRLALDPDTVKGRHIAGVTRFVLFIDGGGEARVNPATGEAQVKLVEKRPVLFEFNVLHLNHIKGAWTWFADATAILLLTLAITGLFMLRGKLGLAGRGKWFALAGVSTPAAFLVAHYMSQ